MYNSLQNNLNSVGAECPDNRVDSLVNMEIHLEQLLQSKGKFNKFLY